MGALTPWTGLATFKQEMDRLFDRFWEADFPSLPALTAWSPALDLSETKDALVIKAEIPGIDPKEIGISLQGEVLTIKGEKEDEKEEKDKQYYRKERTYGAFTRTLRLPVTVDTTKVTAAFKNGLLTVTLPKAPAAKGTMIPIKAE